MAVPTMRRGEIAVLTIRSDYGYGSAGQQGSIIGPYATLIIRIEMFDFRGDTITGTLQYQLDSSVRR